MSSQVTAQQAIQQAIASAEAAQGSYLTFASATQDPSARQMFQSMADDLQRHVGQLQDRLNYLNHSNPTNQQQN